MHEQRLTIFVHRASEMLTDHASHGDGLICFSLLNGLAERGHEVFAYTNHPMIRACSPRLHVHSERHRIPANSLASMEHAWRAERWLRQLSQTRRFDLVWRMHPYDDTGYPHPNRLLGKPLVIGPLFYSWPAEQRATSQHGRPRFGVGLGGVVVPMAQRGWNRVCRSAALLIAATTPHAANLRQRYPGTDVMDLPVIVDPPDLIHTAARRNENGRSGPFRLLFVANLLAYKNPLRFCEIVKHLRESGLNVEGILIGDGPERPALEEFCREQGLRNALCFMGKLPNTEVYRYMRDADLLISLSRGEPYGRSIAEAMAVGTPCVCHKSGGPADFITDGHEGLLVGELDAAAYAEAVSRIYADPILWHTLSTNAAAKADQWTSETVLSRLEERLLAVVR